MWSPGSVYDFIKNPAFKEQEVENNMGDIKIWNFHILMYPLKT